MLCKSLIQFSLEGWHSVPSLLFDLRPNYGGVNEDNVDLQKFPCTHCCTQCPRSCSRALLDLCLHWRILDTHRKSGSVSCGVTAPFPWVLVHTSFCLCPPSVCFPSSEFSNQIPLASKVKFPRRSQSLCQIPRLGNLLWVLELS